MSQSLNFEEILENRFAEDNVLERLMISGSDDVHQTMVEYRREDLFETVWINLDVEREVVLENVRKREEVFISEASESEQLYLPEWLLRLEAQDMVLESMLADFQF